MMYLLKFLGASILLYGVYHFLLRNEKTFKFNRFYLLSILVLAAIIPLVIVKTTVVEIPYQETIVNIIPEVTPQFTYVEPIVEESTFEINWPLVGQVAYGLVSLVLLLRFVLNLRAIRNLRKSGEEITFKTLPLVQSPKVKTTFSFLSRVFVNKAQFKKDGLADEILAHEQVHIQQKHSLDIIFMELIVCLIWFNPVVYFIRRNIKLNHEYLADAGVIAHSKDPNAYQMLLLKYTGKQMILNPLLASHLSYGETKQRFKIMFKTTNKRVAALKQIAALALITGLFFAFGEERVVAQQEKVSHDVPPPPPPQVFKLKPDTPIRFVYANGDSVKGDYGKMSERSKKIFESPEGKGEVFIPRVTYLRLPNKAFIEKYADASKYKVWIDEKLIDANTLKDYSPKDFNNYFITPFRENEKEYGKLVEKVDLWTKAYNAERNAKLPKGTWEPYHPSMSPDHKISTKQKQDVPPPPPPTLYSKKLNDKAKVRYTNTNGELVTAIYGELTASEKERFKKPKANPQVFLPPPPPAFISEKMIEEFQNPKEYGVWLDGKRVDNKVLANYSPNDIHHYFKSRLMKNAKHYGQYTFHLSIYTRKKWAENPSANGSWIDYKEPVRKEFPEMAKLLKQEEIPADYKWGEGVPKELASKHKKEVLHYLTATANTYIKMTLPNGAVMIKKAKEFSREEWYRWWDPAYKGMIFSPPQKEITWDQINEWRDNPDKYSVAINYEILEDIDDLGTQRFAFSEIIETKHDGKTVVNLTPKEKYLDPKYFDTAWMSNVMYKD